MNVRRTAAALAASAVLGALAAPAASAGTAAPSASPKLPAGLHGDKDPTYDAVWRQSIALLAQDTAGVTPSAEAVDWLTGQQCDSGAFAAYRADASAECDAKTPVDSNATAIAVQALAALGGHTGEVGKAVGWLKSVQNEDGGWGYLPGTPSDTNSTSVVVGALAAAGEKPAKTRAGGKSPYDALTELQLGCDADSGDRGAYAFQPDEKGRLLANADATVAGVLAGHGKGLLADPAAGDGGEGGKGGGAPEPLECGSGAEADRTPEEAASGAAAYLTALLEKDGHLTSLAPGADKPVPDHGNTAEAVIALAAAGHPEAAEAPLAWLEKNSAEWAADNPAGLGTLVLAAHAAGGDPRSFGGTDLVKQLNATGPEPESVRAAGADTGEDGEKSGSGNVSALWWVLGAGVLAGLVIGAALLLAGARKKRS
ncbi:terpene cyclase/mutase family protein [Streptomyces sp. F63]|uniref:prenyltransferase/squalene oxidase repeat-containing protein n=1 Tax=Streptomyces sp. F63 TaxID=2824887 RepID=UPI001B382B8C|nr:prenyltransferase/squalene oxidase repeat-containing protein [Streptomyces sp. F63]MBQ0984991.1 terpene cyclase/mutase family protein [Streptomyces sp. F63]